LSLLDRKGDVIDNSHRWTTPATRELLDYVLYLDCLHQ